MASHKKLKDFRDGKKTQIPINEEAPAVEDIDLEEDIIVQSGKRKTRSRTTVNRRGPTHMESLDRHRSKGLKKDIEFTPLGQPIGPSKSSYQSYLGVLVRDKVDITYSCWNGVPKEVKDRIWDSVNLAFNVNEWNRKACMSSCGTKWRQFKSELGERYVFERQHDVELMNKPPTDYLINQATWSAFVISCMSKDFLAKRKKQQEIQAQHKFPHRLSRKGYASFIVENKNMLSGDGDVDRSMLWVEALKNSQGLIEGEELKEKVTQISQYIEESKNSSSQRSGFSKSILERVLDYKEHGRRMRGFGGCISQSAFLHQSRSSETIREQILQNELMVEKEKRAELNERVERLEAIIFETRGSSIKSEGRGSCSVKEKHEMVVKETPFGKSPSHEEVDEVMILRNDPSLEGKLVELRLEPNAYIVGYGTVLRANGPNEFIHGKKLSCICLCIAIDEAMVKDALLPIQTDEHQIIGDDVGSHVAWPKHLIAPRIKTIEKKIRTKEVKKPTLQPSIVPRQLNTAYCYAKLASSISILLDKDVFGHELVVPIDFEDIDTFCRLKPISCSCIIVYIW